MKVRDKLFQTKVWRLTSHHESISKSIAGISRRFRLGQLYSEAFMKHMSSSYVASLTLLKMHVGRKSQRQTLGFFSREIEWSYFR